MAGKEHCSLLLNYTGTGKPFWNVRLLLLLILIIAPTSTVLDSVLNMVWISSRHIFQYF